VLIVAHNSAVAHTASKHTNLRWLDQQCRSPVPYIVRHHLSLRLLIQPLRAVILMASREVCLGTMAQSILFLLLRPEFDLESMYRIVVLWLRARGVHDSAVACPGLIHTTLRWLDRQCRSPILYIFCSLSMPVLPYSSPCCLLSILRIYRVRAHPPTLLLL
jgi:hypothetical protein